MGRGRSSRTLSLSLSFSCSIHTRVRAFTSRRASFRFDARTKNHELYTERMKMIITPRVCVPERVRVYTSGAAARALLLLPFAFDNQGTIVKGASMCARLRERER